MEQQQQQQGGGQEDQLGGGGKSYLCRQSSSRWTPTTDQIRILKDLYYNNGVRSPTAEQIQRISAKLRQYGKIEGKNVFYWFQNHKARERQKKRFTADIPMHHHQSPSPPSSSSSPLPSSLPSSPVAQPVKHSPFSPFRNACARGSPSSPPFNFQKEKLEENDFTGAVFEGKFYAPSEFKALETLPTRAELYAQILGSIKGPASAVVGTIQAPARDLEVGGGQ